MRIGIDAHIVLPQHKRYDPKIARYTEQLILSLLDAPGSDDHTWVLFFDARMTDTKKYERPNVVIQHFPFVQYRTYLPVVYSHMLISAFLGRARLDVFHSPEGLIPFMYPGKIISTFHYVPRGVGDSNLFVRTFMLGARPAFAQLCKRAKRIIVNSEADKKILAERHGYPADRIVVLKYKDIDLVDMKKRSKKIVEVYEEVGKGDNKDTKAKEKAKTKTMPVTAKPGKSKKKAKKKGKK